LIVFSGRLCGLPEAAVALPAALIRRALPFRPAVIAFSAITLCPSGHMAHKYYPGAFLPRAGLKAIGRKAGKNDNTRRR